MTHQELITALLQQDLKHQQLILGLDQLGLDAGEKHQLEIHKIVAQLMEVPNWHQAEWGSVYLDLMQAVSGSQINNTSTSLYPLAKMAYEQLTDWMLE